jgi:putative sensory transduction regulator
MLGRPTSTGPYRAVCTSVANTQAQSPQTGGPAQIDAWLAELGLTAVEKAEREGVASWDLVLDGRKRRGLRVTLIHEPAVALVAWVHFAPPMSDNFRKTYRQLLRWNDELPFAKFALSEDERPVLTAELSASALTRDEVGMLLAGVLAIADLVHQPSLVLMGELRRRDAATTGEPDGAGVALLERYSAALRELI